MKNSSKRDNTYVFCPPCYYDLLLDIGAEEAFDIIKLHTKLLRWDVAENRLFAYPIQHLPFTPSEYIDALILLPTTELRLIYLNSI